MEQLAQSTCRVSFYGHIPNLSGHDLEQPALVDPVLSRAFGRADIQRSFQTQECSASVILFDLSVQGVFFYLTETLQEEVKAVRCFNTAIVV